MSLWTPDGERPIPPRSQAPTAPGPGTGAEEPLDGPPLSPEDEERAREMAHELAEARARLLETDVATVVANHAAGIYELAAIHLTAEAPKLNEARLAIDALAALIEGLEGRLGEGEATLREALHQIRLAYVQRSSSDDPEPQ